MDTMLLKQMLETPTTSSNLVVYDPFQGFDRKSLVKEVLGLANAKVDGPRNILFGVNPGAMNGSTIVGIPDDAIGELKRAHRYISALIEPVLDLAFIFDRINGKLVGALEIDGCEFGPYFLAQDLSDELRRGACWIREDRELVAVARQELLGGHAPAQEEEEEEPAPEYSPDDVNIDVGFNEDPESDFIEVSVPDTSNPPFAEEGDAFDEMKKTGRFTQTLTEVTTRIMSLAKSGRSTGDEGRDGDDAGKEIAEAARKHYFYEECAVKVDLCIRNDSDIDLKDVRVEIGFPRLAGFDVADQIYRSPFDKRSGADGKERDYPDVEHKDDAIFVRTTVASIPGQTTQPLLLTPLRFAVGPKAAGKKIAMQYVVRGPDRKRLDDGRLKVRLGFKKAGDEAAETVHQSLDDA